MRIDSDRGEAAESEKMCIERANRRRRRRRRRPRGLGGEIKSLSFSSGEVRGGSGCFIHSGEEAESRMKTGGGGKV